MAAAVTPRFATPDLFEGPFLRHTQTTGTLANGAHGREMSEFFNASESRVGFKSTFSAMLAAEAGVALGSGPPSGYDPYADALDHITRGTQMRRRFARIPAAEARTLEHLYGPRTTNDRREFGELSPIIPFTAASREAREQLVLDESTVRSERVAPRVNRALAERRAELEEMFWHEAGVVTELETSMRRAECQIEKAKAKVKRLTEQLETTAGDAQQRVIERRSKAQGKLQSTTDTAAPRLRRWHRRHAAGRQLLKQLLDGFSYDGAVRASIGTIEATDREITVEDAIRQIMSLPAKTKRRIEFIAAATAQAEVLRTAAHAAYRLAKQQDPPSAPPRVYTPIDRDYRIEIVTHSVSGASP